MSKIVIPENSAIYNTLQKLVQSCDRVFFSGLPGVGKSLLLQQMALMAQEQGRKVHLLQWDVTRHPFESEEILAKYPEIDGVTHAFIRKAVGVWTRSAILDWHHSYDMPEHILIGEIPLIGNRLMECVTSFDDEVEALLKDDTTQFIIPVPTKEVRQIIEGKREQTIVEPQHENEKYDAPPQVLRALWQDVYKLAYELGLIDSQFENPSYIPEAYQAVFEYLLQHRNSISLSIDQALKPAASVYDLNNIETQLAATPEQVQNIVKQLENDFTLEQIEANVKQWYKI
jgi:hypothetical protein